MESSGAFSLIKEEENKPGLSVIPLHDTDYWEDVQKTDIRVCVNCGTISEDKVGEPLVCPRCGNKEWDQAVF